MSEQAPTAITDPTPEVVAQLLDVVADHSVDHALSDIEQMIARLRGRVVGRNGAALVVDVNGVGYLVHATPSVHGLGDGEIVVEVHTVVREDALQLFGFASADERELFELLLGVNGVGPKVALAIVSGSTPAELRRAIARDDVKIEMADDVLTISGEKKSEKEDKEGDYRVSERSYGAFSRSVVLPSGVDAENIEADLRDGVLTIKAPRNGKARTKTIAIKPAA